MKKNWESIGSFFYFLWINQTRQNKWNNTQKWRENKYLNKLRNIPGRWIRRANVINGSRLNYETLRFIKRVSIPHQRSKRTRGLSKRTLPILRPRFAPHGSNEANPKTTCRRRSYSSGCLPRPAPADPDQSFFQKFIKPIPFEPSFHVGSKSHFHSS